MDVELSLWGTIAVKSARVLETPRLGCPMDVSEPMEKPEPTNQEAIDNILTEEIHQINKISLGEGAAMCQVCGFSFNEGDRVVVYVFRPAGVVMFQVGYVVCGGGQHDSPGKFTLGVRELLVEGRVGRCSDVVTQSSWPVLLAPEVQAMSAAGTKSARKIPDDMCAATTLSAAEDFEEGVDSDERDSSALKMSRGEARRRARQTDDAIRGSLWGDQG